MSVETAPPALEADVELVAEPGLYEDVPEGDYHSDAAVHPLFGPSLSHTGAVRILDSPARFRYEQTHPVVKDAFDVGHAAHAKVLGVGAPIAVIPAEILASNGAVSTKAGKEFVAAARADGLVPIKAEVAASVDTMAEALLEHHLIRWLFEDGQPELTLYWSDPQTQLTMRARLDWRTRLPSGRPAIIDYKTTEKSAAPHRWRRSVEDYGYHQQDSWYREGADLLTGADHAFLFVVQETRPPFLPLVAELDDLAREVGAQRNRIARRTWARCLERDQWPGYEPIVHPVSLPYAAYAPDPEGDLP